MNPPSAPPSAEPQYTQPNATPLDQPLVPIMSRSMKQDAIEAVMLSKEDFDRYTPDDPTAAADATSTGVQRRSRLRNILQTHGDIDNGDLDMCENEDDSTIIQDVKLLKAKKLKSLVIKCKCFAQAHDAIIIIFEQWHGCVRGQTRLTNNLFYAKTPLQLIIRVCHLIDYADVYERGAAQNMPSNTKELVAVKERARCLTELRHDRNFCLGVEFLRTIDLQCNNLDCKCRMNYVDLLGALAFEKETLGKRRLSKRQQKRAKNFQKRHRSGTVPENDNRENDEQHNVQQQATQHHGNQQQGVQQQGPQEQSFEQGVEQDVEQDVEQQDVEAQGVVQYQEVSATQSRENISIGGKKRSRSEIASDSGDDGKYTQRVQQPCGRDSNQPKQVEREQEHNQSSEDSQQESSVQDQVEEGNALQQQQEPRQQEDSDEVEEGELVEVQVKEEVKKESASVIYIVDTEDVQLVEVQMKDKVKIEKARRNNNVGIEDAASIEPDLNRKKRRLLELDAECQSRLVELERIALERQQIELDMKKINASEQRNACQFQLRKLELYMERERQIRDWQKERATCNMLSKLVFKLEGRVNKYNSDGLVKLETSTFSDTPDDAPNDVPTVGSNEEQSTDMNNNNCPDTN